MQAGAKGTLWKRPPLRRLGVVILATYAAVVVCTGVFQGKFIYFPSRIVELTPSAAGLDFEDLTLTTGDGVKIAAWFVPHPQARGTILFFHGNGGNIGDRIDSLRVLHSFGVNVMFVEYRGYGTSAGHPTEAGTYLDAAAGWEYLTKARGLSANSIIIMGESLGGAVAIDLALRHAPAALVVQSSFTNLADIAAMHYPFLPVRWLLVHTYDSITKVGRIACPKLFIHSTGDTLIPLSNGQALFEAAAPPKQLLLTPGDHNEGGFLYSQQYEKELKAFLDSVLTPEL